MGGTEVWIACPVRREEEEVGKWEGLRELLVREEDGQLEWEQGRCRLTSCRGLRVCAALRVLGRCARRVEGRGPGWRTKSEVEGRR